MKDEQIIELFWARDENAIKETEIKYNDLCHYVAKNFLAIHEDREECINDSMLALWNSIPPKRPKSLRAYLTSIVRNIAISRAAGLVTFYAAIIIFAVLIFLFMGLGYAVPSYICLGARYVLVGIALIARKVLSARM